MLLPIPVLAFWLFASQPSTEHQHGVELYRQRKYPEAISGLEHAIQTEQPGSPEYKESALIIGQSYYEMSQAPKAIPWLEKLPAVNEANYMLGYAYLQTGDPAKSVTAFARLFNVNSSSAAAHLLAGEMMLKQEYESQGVAEIRKALDLDKHIPQAWYWLGITAIYRGRFDEAEADLKQELSLNPGFAMAWYRMGDVYARRNQLDAAIAPLQRAIWLNPDFSGPYVLLGKCYLRQHNYANAEGILRHAIVLDPNNASAKYLLGQTLVAEGKNTEGKTLLESVPRQGAPSLEKP